MRSHPQSRSVDLSGLQTYVFLKVTSTVYLKYNMKSPVLAGHGDHSLFLDCATWPNSSVPTCPPRLGSLWPPYSFWVPSWPPCSPLASPRHDFLVCTNLSTHWVPPEACLHLCVCFINLGGGSLAIVCRDTLVSTLSCSFLCLMALTEFPSHKQDRHSSDHFSNKCYCFTKISRQHGDKTETHSFYFKTQSDQNEK